MSLRSRTPQSPDDGEVSSGAEEKANTHAAMRRDGTVNQSTRPIKGSSSQAPRRGKGGGAADHTRDRLSHFRDEDGAVRVPVAGLERSRSPFRRERTRSRSPFRPGKAPSGKKRKYEEDHYNVKSGADSRRFKVHYEERSGPRPAKTLLAYDGSTNKASKGRSHGNGRDRSRSPPRFNKNESTADERKDASLMDRLHGRAYPDARPREQRRGSTPPAKDRESAPLASHTKDDAKIKMSLSQQPRLAKTANAQERSVRRGTRDDSHTDKGHHSQAHRGLSAAPSDLEEVQQANLSEAEIIEQRRKRREAIKARHKPPPGLLVQALEHNLTSAPATPAHDSSGALSEQHSPPSAHGSPGTPQRDSAPPSPTAFVVADDEELANRRNSDVEMNDDDGPSAADYDPNKDLQEDRPGHKRAAAETTQVSIHQTVEQVEEAASKPSKEFDMFADEEDDDMFAATDTTMQPALNPKQAKTLDASLLDNWDYPDGHYRIVLNELLDTRYAVQQQIGKGTFATVVKALDTHTKLPVAIKIAANNET
ncbi:U4/U6 small nuclear ribonucleoprotein prp4, partial [Teratosphaeriaceae sp. CCFEE 6253]